VFLQLTGNEPAKPPVWQEGNDATKFAVDTLLYLQGVAKRAKLPVLATRYTVLDENALVACDDVNDPSNMYGTDTIHSDGIRWCPKQQAFVILPGVIALMFGEPGFLDQARDNYGKMALFVPGQVTTYKDAACYHGVLSKYAVVEGVVDAQTASQLLDEHYGTAFGIGDELRKELVAVARKGFTEGAC
jgi:hypothetical protein